MPADLHIHTTFSDGTYSPEEVVSLAQKAGLTKIAITDHDVVAGIDPAKRKGEELGVEIIPGIELTAEAQDCEIHILGYFIDHKSPALLSELAQIQAGREKRVYKMTEKLKELGVEIDPERVFAIAGHRVAGRPHVARAMVEKGYVGDFKEAFNRYLDFHGPAYVSHYRLSPEGAIKLIKAANGVPVFAHPAASRCDQVIPDMMVYGLQGIEVYYSSHDQGQTRHYLNLAKKYGLLITGGSDFHGLRSGREIELGSITIADELFDKLQAAKR